MGCSGYPECKYIKKEPPKGTGITCPKCKQGELVERRAGSARSFYSCNRYPECDFSVNQQPFPEPCPVCAGLVVAARGGSRRCIACNRAWASDGAELPQEEAQKLIPKPRASRSASGGAARGGSAGRTRPPAKSSAGRARTGHRASKS